MVNFLPLLGRGGGQQNALNLWSTLGRHGGAGHEWLAATRGNLDLPDPPRGSGMSRVVLPVEGRGVGGGRFRAENVTLPRLAHRFGADVIFTPMGTGPLRSRLPRVSGWHDSTSVYLDSPMWAGEDGLTMLLERLRAGYASLALRGACRVVVQTETMGRRVSAAMGVRPERIRVIANGLSSFLAGEPPAPEDPSGVRRILVVTTTQPAKNLGVLPGVARALADLGVRDTEVVATLDPVHGAEAMGLPVRARVPGREPDTVLGGAVPIRCVGPVPHAELGAFYRSGAAVLVPSWVESFTAVYPEAWHFGLPVVTSDVDFARGLCGEAAAYAPPASPEAFARRLVEVLGRPDLRGRLRRAGRTRLAALPSWDRRLELYLDALEQAVHFV